MTIRTTRWSPDTCNCVTDFTWDDSLPVDSITPTLSSIITRCPAHTTLANDSTVWNTLRDENPRKNIALQTVLDNGPSTLYDLVGTTRNLKSTVNFSFSWSGTAPNRVLTISFPGITLTTAQRNAINSALTTKLGSGKVTIV